MLIRQMNHPFITLLVILTISGLLSGIAGCDVLDVDNPNKLIEEDLENPASAPSLANGAEAKVAEAIGSILAPYSTVTDELDWIGTRDGWERLIQGEIISATNEFVDGAFINMAVARWTADEAVKRLEEFRNQGALREPLHLIRSYFYSALIYTVIADTFDDFVFSDRQDAQPPIGHDNMPGLYDEAIGNLDKARDLAENTGHPGWINRIAALKARTAFSKQIWHKIKPEPNTVDPLVNDGQTAELAREALARTDASTDWSYWLNITPSTSSNDTRPG